MKHSVGCNFSMCWSSRVLAASQINNIGMTVHETKQILYIWHVL